jgi:hypothetical protein
MRSVFTFIIALSCAVTQASLTRANESATWKGMTETNQQPTTVEKKDNSTTVTLAHREG